MIYPELLKKVFPVGLLGVFAAIVMGAILSTFNSVLNSASTIFSLDLYKQHIAPHSSDQKLVKIGRISAAVLAVFSILMPPLVAQAPDGLYQLLQQLNGIFFIPIASILIAGFFLPRISALGAKAALFVGLAFYLLTTFVFDTGLHFVHLWGIEFVLNMLVMFSVSHFFPPQTNAIATLTSSLDLAPWKHTKLLSASLCVITVLIYVFLGIQ